MSLLILIDLADPMARHTSDTTQTETVVLNGSNSNPTTTVPPNPPSNGRIPNGVENKPINRITNPEQTETSIQIHDAHEDSRSENHSPPQSNIPLNGTYHRSDEVDFVQTNILPKAEQPVFEKVLLPEKRRPEKQNIPNPRENTSHTAFVTERVADPRMMYDQRQTDFDQKQTAYDNRNTSYDQNDFNHHDEYRNFDYHHRPHQNYGFVKDNVYTPRRLSSTSHQPTLSSYHQMPYDRSGNRPLMVIRDYSNARANMSYEQRIKSGSQGRINPNYSRSVSSKSHCKSRCSSDDDENISAVQPGFVATVAKIWDTRAKRDFNTVV